MSALLKENIKQKNVVYVVALFTKFIIETCDIGTNDEK